MSHSSQNSVGKRLSQFLLRQIHHKNETVQPAEPSKTDEFSHLSTPIESDLEKANHWVDSIEMTEANLTSVSKQSIENPMNYHEQYPALQTTLQDVMKKIPDCKSLAYVDIEQRALLGIYSIQSLPVEIQQLIAAATSDLFTAPNMVRVSNLYKQQKGTNEEKSNFNEMIVHGEEDVYVFIRARNNRNHVSVLACNSTTPSGMVLINARQMMPQIEAVTEAMTESI
ncbi:hypothetical protein JF634_07185 [Simonsiella muelleri]|uniref:Roadblock/LAMTOR2 domain-containing protein n=1 Tax=Simonsiella muelleri ATCC 29453 TaxID=641147 RepID=V9H5K0_9NEIS|nr:hypothetical protein [Simonsiella muelleri]AUX60954.1 hypothetical protein BWP33_03390 [Simonsiella muelleri ATCC 29453]EFG30265.1 hypothetical protein HMPREF9021_01893 [Simonsiella muelleri ATCC 29453]UBQ52997.1 hypothetical protein JF634_07185 [Simonsiella muelleri]